MTGTDPWAAEAAATIPDEAQAPPTQESPWNAPPPEAAKPAVVTNVVPQSEGKIVLTFKEAAGFDASWVVVHAGSVAEANEILDDIAGFKALLDKTKNVATVFRGGAPSKGGNGGGGGNRGGGGRGGAPKGAKQPPPGTPPAPDDTYEYGSGVKNGDPWHAWFPPKGSGKEVVWLPKDLLK